MLQILLRDKLSRELKRSAFDIEDLLTAVVFGSCEYTHFTEALLPFISTALNGKSVSLGEVIQDVICVEPYEFWSREDEHRAGGVVIQSGEPELVLKFQCRGNRTKWLVVEAKLHSGKSSFASEDMHRITDQLAKYWCHLSSGAQLIGADPIGVLYVTKGVDRPVAEIQESLDELSRKEPNFVLPEIYWTSWRRFAPAVLARSDAPSKLISDVITLLQDKWQLTYEPMEVWPMTPDCPFPEAYVQEWIWFDAPEGYGGWHFIQEWIF